MPAASEAGTRTDNRRNDLLPLFEIAHVLVLLDHVASCILNLTWKRKRA
jgi:hypothetical protein